MLIDYHVHTGYSDDSTYPMRQVALDAIRLNIEELCFTEHVDYGIKPEWDSPAGAQFDAGRPLTNCPYEPYFAEIDSLRAELGDHLRIRAGLELGVQRHTIEPNAALVERWREKLDFVICSIHQIDNKEFWNNQYQEGLTQEEINLGHYEEMLAVVRGFHDYSVVGHLDSIRRYDPYGEFPFERVRDVVAAILEQVIADGKGIEVNTSGIRYGMGDFHPTREVLKLYHDLGGTLVTVGSDSHAPEHLGSYLRFAYRELAELGFAGITVFDHMEPTLVPFDA